MKVLENRKVNRSLEGRGKSNWDIEDFVSQVVDYVKDYVPALKDPVYSQSILDDYQRMGTYYYIPFMQY